MADEFARRSHEVMMSAIDVPEPERAAFVERSCAGDVRLRDRVLALLTAIGNTRGFLDTPVLSGAAIGPGAAHRPPAHIEGYDIVGLLGAGGMAAVYEAQQHRPRRRVALKVLRHTLAGTSALRRFEFEIEALARLRHPNVAQIYEAGATRDEHGETIPFLAMEFIPDAKPITTYARERMLSGRERLELFALVCEAVHHGHQNGLIHRDLKPSNVLIDAGGHPKVIDFGVARPVNSEQGRITGHSDVGQLIGTLNYMSPEQGAGTGPLDIRTDVYSLGVILYELLCDRLPHELSRAPLPEALRIVREERPTRPGTIDARLRGDLEAIILKALEKSPDRRYGSAAGLSADVRRYLNSEVVEARAPTLFYQARLFARRHRVLVGAAAAILVTLIGATIVSVWSAAHALAESGRRHAAEIRATEERDAAVRQAYSAIIAASMSAVMSGELEAAQHRLAAAPQEHRGWEWRFLSALAERSLSSVPAHSDMVFALESSPDRSHLATGSRDGSLRIWDADGQTMVADVRAHDQPVSAVAFSPDGMRVITGSYDRTVRVWDVATGSELGVIATHESRVFGVACSSKGLIASATAVGVCQLVGLNRSRPPSVIDGQPGGIQGVSFSPDGERLLTWGSSHEVWVRAAADSTVIHRLALPETVTVAKFSDDGSLIAAGGSTGHFAIWRASSGEVLHASRLPGRESYTRTLAFSPDSSMLVIGRGDRTITFISMETGEVLTVLQGHGDTVSGVRFDTDGSRLYSTSWDRTLRVWSTSGDVPFHSIGTLRGHQDRVLTVAFSPDSSIVATGAEDGTICLWDPDLLMRLGVLHGHSGAVSSIAFSPDNRLIASASYDRTVRLWSATTGELLRTLEGHSAEVWCVRFSHDGKRLASCGSDKTVRLWDVASGSLNSTFEGHSSRVTSVAFSPDDTTIASVSRDETVRLWEVASGNVRHVMPGHQSDVYAVVFSLDGRRCYSGCRDQTVRAWDVNTGECLKVMPAQGQNITSLSMSADGLRLAAGSWFGDFVIWDLSTLEIVLSFKAHDDVVRGVAFDPGGRWLASASNDRTVRIFDAAPLREQAQQRSSAHAAYEQAMEMAERAARQPAGSSAIEADGPPGPWGRKVALMNAIRSREMPAAR